MPIDTRVQLREMVMKSVLAIGVAAFFALTAVQGEAHARAGDRGENYDGLKRKHKTCTPPTLPDGKGGCKAIRPAPTPRRS